MALKIETGDVFNELAAKDAKGEPVMFVHGCNAQGVMGSGIAALVKKIYPFAYMSYKADYKDYGLHVGDVSFNSLEGCNVEVVNAITQEYYGRDGKVYVSYDGVIKALTFVAKRAKSKNVPVHLPLIGGGLGGGDAKRLTAIFQAVFYDVDATLWLKEG